MLKIPNQTGFSVIELLMVVVIIGLLATVAVPSLLSSRDAAEKAATIGALRSIHSYQTTYLSQRGRYARINELNAYFNNTLGTTSGARVLRGKYTYINGLTNRTTLATRYQLWAIKYVGFRAGTTFVIEQDGVIEAVEP